MPPHLSRLLGFRPETAPAACIPLLVSQRPQQPLAIMANGVRKVDAIHFIRLVNDLDPISRLRDLAREIELKSDELKLLFPTPRGAMPLRDAA